MKNELDLDSNIYAKYMELYDGTMNYKNSDVEKLDSRQSDSQLVDIHKQ